MRTRISASYLEALAADCVERHRIPKATAVHPKGVVVPDDEFMTKNLQDPDYVPYCGSEGLFHRLRRTEFGFDCPRCPEVKLNFDLTPFNDNKDVKYEVNKG